jgi:tRNA U34 2-thiouridine synthase MnmA/TrmU
LISGGLDSTLAVKIVADLGVEVIAMNVSTVFCSCNGSSFPHRESRALTVATSLGIPLVVHRAGPDYVEMVKAPRFGYGKALNPCQDCRIYTFRLGKALMEEQGASFLFTGEVLGQRPMSQQRAQLARIEREAGLSGLVLRPLSARQLPPTVPEKEGWVDRKKLLDIAGRSRHRQIELARTLGVVGLPCAGGGCLLTERGFSAKVQDAILHAQDSLEQLLLLKTGRHFRLDPETKLVVGRNEPENRVLAAHGGPGRIFYRADGVNGPTALLDTSRTGPGAGGAGPCRRLHGLAAGILLRYADAPRDALHRVLHGPNPYRLEGHVMATALSDAEIARRRIPELPARACERGLGVSGPARGAAESSGDVDWLICRGPECKGGAES